jgi:hypothetical protein
MRIAELLSPQEPSKKKTSNGTVAEVFIIESLSLIDEAKERHEGEVLANVLRMCGKKPLYYYIRTKAELEMLAEEFEASGYRYLHLSCHGGDTTIETTIDSVPYVEFAQMFDGRLKHRRLFASACGAGNQMFAELVGARNKGMHSVAGPSEEMQFDHAVAFWSAFYVKAFSVNRNSMNARDIPEIMKPLVSLFGTPIHWSRYSNKKDVWSHELLQG